MINNDIQFKRYSLLTTGEFSSNNRKTKIKSIKLNRYPFRYCFKLHGILLSNGYKCTVEQNGAFLKQYSFFFLNEIFELNHEKDKQQMVRKNCMTIVYKVKILQHL